MAAKLTDIQTKTLVVPTGGAVINPAITVTHNLKDAAGAHLAPDEVNVEIVAVAGPGANPDECIICQITRSSPEDGTYVINGKVPNANASGNNWTYTARVTSKYNHSIQSSDH